MREIQASVITERVARLCKKANFDLGEDVLRALNEAVDREDSSEKTRDMAQDVLRQIIENAAIAYKDRVPMCQDCGVAVFFVEIGQDLHVVGGDISDAINAGVRKGYSEGYLRKSIAEFPLKRDSNTGDNTPAVIHYQIVPGDRLKITFAPKGAGSENVSALRMLTPAEGRDGVRDFVVECVKKAGPNPCPPIIVGVGIGGTFEKAAIIAKQALMRPIGEPNPDKDISSLEQEILKEVNALGIGPAGFGGLTTALAVNIETYPCHIGSLPVAVNINCHAARHKETTI
jgi:fumarate hydratase subunit alpha